MGLTKPFLTAEWRDLVILNYPVPPERLLPLVPRGTTLDLWHGHALVSVVGFRFCDTRVLGVGIPGHRNFEEVNLRFYVRRVVSGELRRAVVFVRELVPRVAIAWTARIFYNEPYRALPMRHSIESSGDRRTLRYEWKSDGQWVGLSASTRGASAPLEPASEAEFITEHYWGYTSQRDGGTFEYRVEHPAWRVWEATDARCIGNLEPSYGRDFAAVVAGEPCSAFVAEGSPVTVYRPHRLTAAELRGDVA